MSGILPDVPRCPARFVLDCLLPDGHQGPCEVISRHEMAEAQAPILAPFDRPVFDHPLTNDCIGGGCEDCER